MRWNLDDSGLICPIRVILAVQLTNPETNTDKHFCIYIYTHTYFHLWSLDYKVYSIPWICSMGFPEHVAPTDLICSVCGTILWHLVCDLLWLHFVLPYIDRLRIFAFQQANMREKHAGVRTCRFHQLRIGGCQTRHVPLLLEHFQLKPPESFLPWHGC